MKKTLITVLALGFAFLLAVAPAAFAAGNGMMGGSGGSGMMAGGSGMMGGDAQKSPMMANTSGMGMMAGMAGTPVIGSDGTAYIVTSTPKSSQATPTSNSFESRLIAVDTAGNTNEVTLKGIISRPVVSNTTLIVTASLPDFSNFTMMTDYATTQVKNQSALYVFTLPLTAASAPQGISLDGGFASAPVVSEDGKYVYVTTSDFGNAMMQGNSMFSAKFGGYNFNKKGAAKTYLYIFNAADWSLVSKMTI